MGKPTIENPKVFISYAWEDDGYKEQVRSFATSLMNDHVEVILDQWELKAGNDMYAFMEKCVTDPSVTNVLILMSPKYAEKADARSGGVGAETQIISAELYAKTDQTKFIPVLFKKGEDGSVLRPAYLKPTLYVDLSDSQAYGLEYKRLVRMLFGIEAHKKPELGEPPSWLDNDEVIPAQNIVELESLRGADPPQIKYATFKKALEGAFGTLSEWDVGKVSEGGGDDYASLYISALPLRDSLLAVFKYYPHIENGHVLVADAFERFQLDLRGPQTLNDIYGVKTTLLHELFIYFVAIMSDYNDYVALGHVFGRSYRINGYSERYCGCGVFFNHDDKLEEAVKKRDRTSYLSAMGKFWLENINVEACGVESFILADELCYNATILYEEYGSFGWFPKTYIYDRDDQSIMRRFASRLHYEEGLAKIATGFGFDGVESFAKKYRAMEENAKAGKFAGHGYFEAYYQAPLMCYFVPSDELGRRPARESW